MTDVMKSERDFESAVTEGDFNKVRRLAEAEDVHDKRQVLRLGPKQMDSGLHLACRHDKVGIVRYLLRDKRVDVNALAGGRTPLHVAAELASYDVVRVLIRSTKADVDSQDTHGLTPLHLACLRLRTDIARCLIVEGRANVDIKCRRGETPLYLILKNTTTPHFELLRYMVPRATTIDANYLQVPWTMNQPWKVRTLLMQRYVEQKFGLSTTASPLHTALMCPLPSSIAYMDCLECFRTSLCTMDENFQLPLLISLNNKEIPIDVVVKAMELEPRAAIVRDPVSGFFPFQLAATGAANARQKKAVERSFWQKHHHDDDETLWLTLVFRLLRHVEPEKVMPSSSESSAYRKTEERR